MKAIVLFLIAGLIALTVVLPASAAGQGGYGKMFQNGSDTEKPGISQNPDCPRLECRNNQTPPRDGTGMQSGRSEDGRGTGGHGNGHRFRT